MRREIHVVSLALVICVFSEEASLMKISRAMYNESARQYPHVHDEQKDVQVKGRLVYFVIKSFYFPS